jgi:hypothetical protein
MPRAFVIILLVLVAFAADLAGQTRRTTRRPARPPVKPAPTELVREQPLMQCPSILGNGLTTQRLYCDVLAGTDLASGLRVNVPPHTGPATLYLVLHNRQTYSESEIKAGRGFARYTATLRLVSGTGDLIGTAIVRSEFRQARDLVERIGGGAGPGGVKAVAPTGSEPVALEIPEAVTEVVLLGDRVRIERLDGSEEILTPGRPIAVASQIEIEYRPVRAATPARSRRE